ncbi:MAG: (d)CMP kinase [Deltaproteobacteria bacterium]|nr:(d)CMP kinase [Deltaproteobacteria bacterium]
MSEGTVVIAIDGPAGAGKSTVAKALASRLGYTYVDTGAIYRSVALLARRAKLSPEDEPALVELASKAEVFFKGPADGQAVILNGEDVTEEIRTPAISQLASKISALPRVRAELLDLQRRAAVSPGAVLEGRDIGTVVFPDAKAKFFLTADSKERARRRYKQLTEKGEQVTLEQVLKEQEIRDKRDTNRQSAPLKKAEDAEEVDTSKMGVQDVVKYLLGRLSEKKVDAG